MSYPGSEDLGVPTTRQKPGLLSGGRTYFILAVAFALLAMLGSFLILGQSVERTTYYVINQDLPARSQVTADMLFAIETAAGTEPPNSLTPADFTGEPLYAQVPLRTGDVLTVSLVGPISRVGADVPEGFVITSFKVDPENAVAGKVRTGDFIDVLALLTEGNGSDAQVARYVLSNILVLDVTVDPNTIAQAATDNIGPDPESGAVRAGIPYMYIIALSPEDAARLALARTSELMVTLTREGAPSPAGISVTLNDLLGNTPTDPTTPTDPETPTDPTTPTDPEASTDPAAEPTP